MIPALNYFIRPVLSLLRFILKAPLPPVRRLLLMFYAVSGCLMLMCSCSICSEDKKSRVEVRSCTYEESVLKVNILKFGEQEAPTEIIDHNIYHLNGNGYIEQFIQVNNQSGKVLFLVPIMENEFDSLFFKNKQSFKIDEGNSDIRLHLFVPDFQNASAYFDKKFWFNICDEQKNCKITVQLKVKLSEASFITTWSKILNIFLGILLLAALVIIVIALRNYTRSTGSINIVRAFSHYTQFETEFNQMKKSVEKVSTENENLIAINQQLNLQNTENQTKIREIQQNAQKEESRLNAEIQKLNNNLTVKDTYIMDLTLEKKEKEDKIKWYEGVWSRDQTAFKELLKTLNLITKEDLGEATDNESLEKRLKQTNLFKTQNKLESWINQIGKGKTPDILEIMEKDRAVVSEMYRNRIVILKYRWSETGKMSNNSGEQINERIRINTSLVDLIREIQNEQSENTQPASE